MKICYFDESGTGEEPVVVVTAVIVDTQRMHVTKEHWSDLLDTFSDVCGRKLQELQTRDFHGGTGPFRKMAGTDRAKYISVRREFSAGGRDRHSSDVSSAGAETTPGCEYRITFAPGVGGQEC
jgi:hypothetical protein